MVDNLLVKCYCSGALTTAPDLTQDTNISTWDSGEGKLLDFQYLANSQILTVGILSSLSALLLII
jgi:hypothetical protein